MTLRERARRLVEAKAFQAAVMVLIVVNSVTQGLETWPPAATGFGGALKTFDHAVVVVFCIEISVRLFAHGWRFFRDPWSVFDLAVVGVSVAATSDSLSVLRALRVLRVLRLVSAVPRMRRVVAALLHAVPGVASVAALLLLVFYVFSVMATKLFGPAFPAWFGSIGESMFSLFQIMTLESWSMGIVRPVMEVYPTAWIFFVPFIVITAFSVLNLFIGLLVNTMQSAVEDDAVEEFSHLRQLVRSETDVVDAHVMDLMAEVKALRREVAELKGQDNG